MLKMVMVVYNEALDPEVMQALEECGLKNYTKINAVYGKGTSSGTHLGDDIWPGRNNLLYVACAENCAHDLIARINKLRKVLSKEGVKAFVWDLEDVSR